jgi:choline-sulfatase
MVTLMTDSTQPNILLLFSDEHSFRFMGHVPEAAGGEPVHTPNFDRLAAQATVFSDAYCQMPLCTPSRMCLLSGREARNCGAWNNDAVMDPALPTMPKVLGAAGYATALIGKMHFGGNLQFHGFQQRPYGDLLGNTGHQWEPLQAEDRNGTVVRTRDSGLTEIPASKIQDEVVAQETVAYLREQRHANPDQPWFVCASFSRPHFPLTAPARHLDRYWPEGVTPPKIPASGDAYDHPMSVGMRQGFQVDRIDQKELMRSRAAYFACVTYLDEVIGDLLLRLEADGLLENTIIIYTSDHGEMAGEHGTWWKNGWYEACTHIPMIISLPEQRYGNLPAQQISTPVGLVDLFPTFCGLADVAPPADLDGADLATVLQGTAPAPDRPIFCDNLIPRWGEGTEFRMIRQEQYKYVHFRNAPPLFFDLAADPGEQHNLIDSAQGEAATMCDQLQQIALQSLDFAAAEQERLTNLPRLKEQYPLDLPRLDGNQYLMPSGRLVDGDDTLYSPDVLSEHPAELFADWPGN